MPNRILREEIWESDRFLSLAHPIEKLVFVRFLSLADDLGNFKASIPRIFRLTRDLGVQSEESVAKILGAMVELDLIRMYPVGLQPTHVHIPRFRQRVRYVTRRCEGSPWDDPQLIQQVTQKKSDYSQSTVSPRSDSSRPEVEVEVEVEELQKLRAEATTSKPPRVSRGTRLPSDWQPAENLKTWAEEERPDLDYELVVASFVDYWVAKPGRDGVKLDWDRTFRNWVRRERAGGVEGKNSGGAAWWTSEAGIMAKGKELGLTPRGGESWDAFRGRINAKLAEVH